MNKALLTVLAAAPLAFLASPNVDSTPVQSGISIVPGLGNFNREPVLIYNVTGSTLAGPFHRQVTVYTDGLVTGGECTGLFGSSSGGTTTVSAAQARKLQKDLVAAGGLKLGDKIQSVADLPLTTVTVFGRGSTTSNTYSYFLADGDHAAVAQVIFDFVSANPVTCPSIASEQ